MKFTGLIQKALPLQTGVGKTSGKEWKKRTYIVLYDNNNPQYPKSLAFDVMGDRIDSLNIQENATYELDIDFETKEFNGRYYSSASCWRATPVVIAPMQPQAAVAMPTAQPATTQPNAQQSIPAPAAGDNNDLPF